MPKHSISQAAKLAGISRTYLYKKYIHTGAITVETDVNGEKSIDTSELLRVFGRLHGDDTVDSNHTRSRGQELTQEKDSDYKIVETQLKAANEMIETLRTQLQEAKDREGWLKGQLDTATRLLEYKKEGTAAPGQPDLVAKIGNLEAMVEEVAFQQGQKKGFFSRLFGTGNKVK